jgi:ankyrin repeat protein
VDRNGIDDSHRVRYKGCMRLICKLGTLALWSTVILASPDQDLSTAAMNNDLRGVKAALKAGANPNSRSAIALVFAAGNGNVEIVKTLIAAKVRLNEKIQGGLTPVMAAVNMGKNEVLALLLKAGANGNLADDSNYTPLRTAVLKKNSEATKILIAAKVNLNAKGSYDRTALMDAAEKGDIKIVDLLLKAKANPNIKTKYGQTALTLARDKQQNAVVKMLVAAGASTSGDEARPNEKKHPTSAKSGIAAIDRFLAACDNALSKSLVLNKNNCEKHAECVAQGIYRDSFVCTVRDCNHYQRPISEKIINSCAQSYAIAPDAKPYAIGVANWAWGQKPAAQPAQNSATGPGRPSNNSAPPKPGYDHHKENRDFNRYKNCLNSGKRGC